MICPNCGGEFHKEETKCPYCGYLNVEGSHKQYQRKMNDIKDDLNNLDDAPKEIFQQELKQQSKKTLNILKYIIFTTVILLVGGWLISGSFLFLFDKEPTVDDLSKQLAWQQQNFPQLDAWFEEGNYDAIIKFKQQLNEEASSFNIRSWEHFSYIMEYDSYLNIERCKNYMESDMEIYYSLSGIAISYYHNLNYYQSDLFSDDEKVVLETYQQARLDFLSEFGIGKSDILELIESCKKEYTIDYKKIDEYFKEVERAYHDKM